MEDRADPVRRAKAFLTKPTRLKYVSAAFRMRKLFPRMPIPLRLPFGALWLAEASALDYQLLGPGFETAEMQIAEGVIKPGMTVLDIGAHHGLFTLLFSKLVGRQGRVIAFEPSPREMKRLHRHLRLNRRTNVTVESCALGKDDGESDLYLPEKFEDWCNSLRPPVTNEPTLRMKVEVRRLDGVLEKYKIDTVDFVKIDVEGAELDVLQGATRFLGKEKKPVLLIEAADSRTAPWGYKARDIVQLLEQLGYDCCSIREGGRLEPVPDGKQDFCENLVALPRGNGDRTLSAGSDR